MSPRTRRASIQALVVATLAWPLVHGLLVARFELDPWELFGWAMYSEPAPRVQVRVEVERSGEWKPLRAMGGLRRAVREYARRRTTLGRIASPDALVAEAFASDPTIERLRIVERRIRLDPGTAHLVGEAATRVIDRP